MHWSYPSRFYGRDVRRIPPEQAHALIGNYQKLVELKADDEFVVLKLVRGVRSYVFDSVVKTLSVRPLDEEAEREAIAYYQTASYSYPAGRRPHTAGTAHRISLPHMAATIPKPWCFPVNRVGLCFRTRAAPASQTGIPPSMNNGDKDATNTSIYVNCTWCGGPARRHWARGSCTANVNRPRSFAPSR